MLTPKNAVSFLKQNPVLSISVLEKEAQLPGSTLSKALIGNRQLNQKHLAALYPVPVKLGHDNPKKQAVQSLLKRESLPICPVAENIDFKIHQ